MEDRWDDWYVKGLSDFIAVPNLSPMYDKDFFTNGLIQQAAECVDGYIKQLDIKGMARHDFIPEGRPPLIVYVVEPSGGSTKNLMLYGHLDKQPWMLPWTEGLHPATPVLKGNLLYGRGGADDGYSPFSCMLGIANLQAQGLAHPRCALVLETEEESGSPNLVYLLNEAKEVIGEPDYMFCMDSFAYDYDQLWVTSSLRGITIVDLTVEAAMGGYHSGEVGGIVPETFRITRELLNRVDNSATGEVCGELNCPVPEAKMNEARFMAETFGDAMFKKYNMNEGV